MVILRKLLSTSNMYFISNNKAINKTKNHVGSGAGWGNPKMNINTKK